MARWVYGRGEVGEGAGYYIVEARPAFAPSCSFRLRVCPKSAVQLKVIELSAVLSWCVCPLSRRGPHSPAASFADRRTEGRQCRC